MPNPAALAAEDLWSALAFLLVAVATMVVAPRDRRALVRLTIVFALSLALRALAPNLSLMALPSVGRVVGFLGLLLEGITVIRLAAIILFGVLLRAVRIETPRIGREMLVALATIGYVLVLFSRFHVDVAGIVATSAVITAILGFSLQDTLTNVMGGLSLQLDRSIRPGDWIRTGSSSGRVQEIAWRHTSLETRQGDTVLIPNAVLARSEVVLLGRRDAPRLQDRRMIPFFVGDQIPPHDVFATILEAFGREPLPDVSTDPRPEVLLVAFESSWVTYAVRYWLTEFRHDEATDSLVRTRVFYALERAGIPFSIPSQNVLLGRVDEQFTAPRKARDASARRQAVDGEPIFGTLTDAEKETLASALAYAPFAPGEAIVLQGDVAEELFVLTRGRVEVRVSVEGATGRTIATLDAPSIFGEMGLLTGESRRATVVARSDVESWRLRRAPFERLLKERPSIADEMSRVLAARQVELAAARDGLSEEARRAKLMDESGALRLRIQRFFGLG